jgi:hypothetical protein
VAIVHDSVKESSQVLPHPSVVFHAYASVDTPWVAQHYPVEHPYGGKVSSNSATHKATMFVGLHISRMR